MIAIVDYGMGNLRSVQKAFQHIGTKAKITQDPKEIMNAERIVLPGVGAFKVAMQRLESLHLVSVLKEILKTGRPYLGICLGLQLLFDESDEFGKIRGLGIFPGRVKKFNKLKVPHMGWNQIKKTDRANSLKVLEGIPDNSFMYFCHSYFVAPRDESIVTAYTEYGQDFVSMINKDNITGVQFHPEKSQVLGIKILENFTKA